MSLSPVLLAMLFGLLRCHLQALLCGCIGGQLPAWASQPMHALEARAPHTHIHTHSQELYVIEVDIFGKLHRHKVAEKPMQYKYNTIK